MFQKHKCYHLIESVCKTSSSPCELSRMSDCCIQVHYNFLLNISGKALLSVWEAVKKICAFGTNGAKVLIKTLFRPHESRRRWLSDASSSLCASLNAKDGLSVHPILCPNTHHKDTAGGLKRRTGKSQLCAPLGDTLGMDGGGDQCVHICVQL